MSEATPAKVLREHDYSPLPNRVVNATADTSILMDCPGCGSRITLGPRTGAHEMNLPWLSSLCPACGARFRVVQSIDITWQRE